MEKIIKLTEKYLYKLFNWFQISNNKNLTIEIIDKYPDKEWHWGKCGISNNPNLTMEMIEKYPDKEWHWGTGGISSNPTLTIKMIDKYPDKKWHWGKWGISHNPNLTIEMIEKYPDKEWHWGAMSCNNFHWEETKEYYRDRKQQTIDNTMVFQEELIAAAWHPVRFQDWCLDNEDKSFHED